MSTVHHWFRGAWRCNTLKNRKKHREAATENEADATCGRCKRSMQPAPQTTLTLTSQSNRDEWLKRRRKGIGSSDVAAVLGLPGTYRGAHSVWRDKMGIDDGEPDEDAAILDLGNLLEPAILLYAGATPGELVIDDERPWMLGTPDGFDYDGAGVECKLLIYGDYDKRKLQWEMQCRWLMALTKRPRWRLVMLDIPAYLPLTFSFEVVAAKSDAERLEAVERLKRAEFSEVVFERDEAVEAEIIKRVGAWWRHHIVDGVEPPPDGDRSTGRYQNQRFASPEGDWSDDHDIGDTVAELVRLKTQNRENKKRIDLLQQQIQASVGNHEGVRGHWGTCKWSRFNRKSFDKKALIEARPDLAPLIEKFTESRPTGRLYPKLRD